MKTAVIIAAGGSGKRFGSEKGKQLFEYQGKPIIIHTIENFINNVDQIIVVIKKEDQQLLREKLKEFNLAVDAIVEGGAERYDSVINGLAKLSADITHVMIHDGARPNITVSLIERLRTALKEHQAVIPVIPAVDTIKIIKDNIVVNTPDRSQLFHVQTPQGFEVELIKKAYKSVVLADCTDDAMVVERFGTAVYAISGEENNLKITRKDDLQKSLI
jgi:2-C-methyl-D-erythritol 4-phosphate cytidylyltransferase